MRKGIKLILVIAGVLAVIAGCGSGQQAGESMTEVTDSAQLLNLVWNEFDENQRFYAMGGDYSNPVDNAAGIFNIEDTDNLTYILHVPESNAVQLDEAASLVHAMNANTFTGAAFHLKDKADADEFVQALKDNILNTQWVCGFPDELVIYVVNGEYIVSAFGSEENISNFKEKLTQIYGEGAVAAAEEKLV